MPDNKTPEEKAAETLKTIEEFRAARDADKKGFRESLRSWAIFRALTWFFSRSESK